MASEGAQYSRIYKPGLICSCSFRALRISILDFVKYLKLKYKLSLLPRSVALPIYVKPFTKLFQR